MDRVIGGSQQTRFTPSWDRRREASAGTGSGSLTPVIPPRLAAAARRRHRAPPARRPVRRRRSVALSGGGACVTPCSGGATPIPTSTSPPMPDRMRSRGSWRTSPPVSCSPVSGSARSGRCGTAATTRSPPSGPRCTTPSLGNPRCRSPMTSRPTSPAATSRSTPSPSGWTRPPRCSIRSVAWPTWPPRCCGARSMPRSRSATTRCGCCGSTASWRRSGSRRPPTPWGRWGRWRPASGWWRRSGSRESWTGCWWGNTSAPPCGGWSTAGSPPRSSPSYRPSPSSRTRCTITRTCSPTPSP